MALGRHIQHGAAAAGVALFGAAAAGGHPAVDAFARHCFSPFLTAQTAAKALAVPGARVDFYDIDPFGSAAPSLSDDVAAGTDRRCSVAFDGDHTAAAANAVTAALSREGIVTPAPVPARYTKTDTTALLAARTLNPKRIAVVIVGTRPGPNGVETHMTVERLLPLTN